MVGLIAENNLASCGWMHDRLSWNHCYKISHNHLCARHENETLIAKWTTKTTCEEEIDSERQSSQLKKSPSIQPIIAAQPIAQ